MLGGPNGSGKSTIHHSLRPVGAFLNADVAARRIDPISPESASLAAGRFILHRLARTIRDGDSFVYETTLSSRQSVALMSRCRERKYEVALIFVALDSVELNVRRVAERVARGGHDIAEHVIRRRYDKSFANLPEAMRQADRVLLLDNSGREPELLVSIDFGTVVVNRLREAAPLHERFAEALEAAKMKVRN